MTALGDFVTSIVLYTYDTRPLSLEILSSPPLRRRRRGRGDTGSYSCSSAARCSPWATNGKRSPLDPPDGFRPRRLQRLSVLIAVSLRGHDRLRRSCFRSCRSTRTDLGATPKMIGVLIASFSIAQLVSAPFWGRVSDRYGRRPALLIGLTASTLAFVVFGVAKSFWLLLPLAARAGRGRRDDRRWLQAYVADTIEPADRAKALGWLSAATSAGVMIGPVLGSVAVALGHDGARPRRRRALPRSTSSSRGGGSLNRASRRAPRRPASRSGTRRGRCSGIPPARCPVRLDLRRRHARLHLPDRRAGSLPGREFGVTERTIGYFFLYVGTLASSCGRWCWGRS